MYNVTFYENRALVMSKLTDSIPSVNDNITLKGRKGTVTEVKHVDDKTVHISILFEKVIKRQVAAEPNKKRK